MKHLSEKSFSSSALSPITIRIPAHLTEDSIHILHDACQTPGLYSLIFETNQSAFQACNHIGTIYQSLYNHVYQLDQYYTLDASVIFEPMSLVLFNPAPLDQAHKTIEKIQEFMLDFHYQNTISILVNSYPSFF